MGCRKDGLYDTEPVGWFSPGTLRPVLQSLRMSPVAYASRAADEDWYVDIIPATDAADAHRQMHGEPWRISSMRSNGVQRAWSWLLEMLLPSSCSPGDLG